MSLDCTICAEGRHGHLCQTSCAMGTTYDEDSNQCTPLGILPTVISLIFLARALSTDKRKRFLSLFVSFPHTLGREIEGERVKQHRDARARETESVSLARTLSLVLARAHCSLSLSLVFSPLVESQTIFCGTCIVTPAYMCM